MINAINSGVYFLINTFFDIFIFLVFIRLILVAVRVDYYNPLSQVIVKFTQPAVGFLRRIIPNFRNIELASVCLILLLEMIKFLFLGLLLIGIPNFFGLVILACADSLKTLINIFFYAILIQAIMSWVNSPYSPIAQVLTKITSPITRPFQRFIPRVNGIDISPIPAMITMQLIQLVLISPIFTTGWRMAFR
jgi:YggT family protein